MSLILAPFPDMLPMAETMAPALTADIRPIGWRHFPDGESLVTVPEDVAGRDVAVLATLRAPDRLALALRFAAATLRSYGAARVGLIAPYLGYMRQDKRFQPGEAISAPLFASFLQDSFDWLLTADPHLHRNPDLQKLFRIPARHVATAPLLADWIVAHVPDAVLLGPDSESQQWVADVARRAGRPYEVLRKIRTGDRAVEISVPDSAALRVGTPVILDDIASSGRTLVGAIERLAETGSTPPICVVIHAVFANAAFDDILRAGAARIVTTDSIPHTSNTILVGGLLAAAAKKIVASLDLPVTGRSR